MPANPLRRRPPLLLLGLAALALPVLAVACSSESDEPERVTIEDVSFEVPGNWSEGTIEDSELASNQEWEGLIGLNDETHIFVSKYLLNLAIDADVLAENLDSLDVQIKNLLESDGGEVDDGPTETEVATLPALRYEGTTEEDGDEYGHIWVFIFDQEDQYFVNCSWDEDHEDEMRDACQAALESFALE